MLDKIIKGGQVVTPSGTGNWDVGIQGEKIVAVALPGILPEEGVKIIDAGGKIGCPVESSPMPMPRPTSSLDPMSWCRGIETRDR